jgi:hypothetical protein
MFYFENNAKPIVPAIRARAVEVAAVEILRLEFLRQE